ncbi:MAG: hypothetical protein ACXAEX_18230 [Promethearchaeota archaeon]
MVDNEIKLNRLGLDRYCDLDEHKVIDTLGVGMKYFKARKIKQDLQKCENFELHSLNSYEFGQNILKGVEVKTSRSDFKNGFICSGCNYHYVLTPVRLVAHYEVPEGVGLIEFNKYKFSCKPNPQIEEYPESKPFKIKGLRIIKRPRFNHIPQFQIDNAIKEILSRKRYDTRILTLKEVEENTEKMTYQRPPNAARAKLS